MVPRGGPNRPERIGTAEGWASQSNQWFSCSVRLSEKRVLSYEKRWCPGAESNHRHEDFQSSALPTELPGRFEQLCSSIRRLILIVRLAIYQVKSVFEKARYTASCA